MAGFHGDQRYQSLVELIVQQIHSDTIIETGTYEGDSTREFAKMAKTVHTIEIREDFHKKAMWDSKGFDNIVFWLGSSKDKLPEVIQKTGTNTVIFLDAHWQDEWPLQIELEYINNFKILYDWKFVIIIDDFQHPIRPNFYGSNGGGGTIGDNRYGPRTKIDNTPCDINTFDKYLKTYKELWFPCYDATTPGYCIASDFALNLKPNAELLNFNDAKVL